MLFTLVIWVVSMLCLALALVLYLFFLWHHIHNETLNGFCRRKIETRLERIVKAKTEKIWAKQQAKLAKEEAKNGGRISPTSDFQSDKMSEFAGPGRQPTLPSLEDSPPKAGELRRTESMATLPPYTSKPGTPLDANPPQLPRQPTLPDLGRPGPPSRSFTSSTGISQASYSSTTNLLGGAEPMDYSDPRPMSPAGSYPGKPGPYNRPGTSNSNRPYGPPLSTPSSDPRFPPPARTNTGFSSTTGRNSPMSATSTDYLQSPELSRPGTAGPNQRRSPLSPLTPYGDRTATPSSRAGSYEMNALGVSATDAVVDSYFGPSASSAPAPSRTPAPRPTNFGPPAAFGPLTDPPRRDFSAPPGAPRAATPTRNFARPPLRSATAPIPHDGYGPPARSATAGPGGAVGPGQGWR